MTAAGEVEEGAVSGWRRGAVEIGEDATRLGENRVAERSDPSSSVLLLLLLPITPQVEVTGFISACHPQTSLGLARPRQKRGPSPLRQDR